MESGSCNLLGEKLKTKSGEAFVRVSGDRFSVIQSVNGGIRSFNGILKTEESCHFGLTSRKLEDLVRILDYKHEERKTPTDFLYNSAQALFDLEPIIDCVIPPEAFNVSTDFLSFYAANTAQKGRLLIELVDDKSVVFSWPIRGNRFFCLKPRRLENIEGEEIQTVQIWTPDFFDQDIFRPENLIRKDRREEVRRNKKSKKRI